MITAQDAVDQLFRVAVTENKATSTARLDTLAELCVQELTRRGLHGAAKEASIPGAGRRKRWDVAWQYDGKYRLGLSLKSILKNLGGTVPNRIDDLIGEVANAQLLSPEIVIGEFLSLAHQPLHAPHLYRRRTLAAPFVEYLLLPGPVLPASITTKCPASAAHRST